MKQRDDQPVWLTASGWPIYKWDGTYFGFLTGGCFFDAKGRYLGWVTEEGAVWHVDGRFLGELVDGHYVLRRMTMVEPVRRVPRARPMPPMPPVPSLPRVPRIPRLGWTDALENMD